MEEARLGIPKFLFIRYLYIFAERYPFFYRHNFFYFVLLYLVFVYFRQAISFFLSVPNH